MTDGGCSEENMEFSRLCRSTSNHGTVDKLSFLWSSYSSGTKISNAVLAVITGIPGKKSAKSVPGTPQQSFRQQQQRGQGGAMCDRHDHDHADYSWCVFIFV